MPAPETSAALVQGGAGLVQTLLAHFLGDGGAQENEKAERKLSRQEMLIELILKMVDAENANARAANEAQFIAPALAAAEQKKLEVPKLTQLRNAATGKMNAAQPGGGDPGLQSLVINNANDYMAQKQRAVQAGQRYTPESLYVPQANPLQAVQENAPEVYMDMAGKQKYSNKPGDGLDDIEVQMLNKAVATGRSPQDISKMLNTFRQKEVQGGVASG